MSNEISSSTFGYQVQQLKSEHNKSTDGPFGQVVSAEAHSKNKVDSPSAEVAKQQYNAAIVSSSMEASIEAGNQPMTLLFKAALEGINEALKSELGDDAIQNAYQSGLDVSPEATADRIVSLSTAFFPQYRDQNPEMSDEEAATKFAEIIGGGIDKGFADARDILGGLSVLEGEIASNIDSTYELVQKGLQQFVGFYAADSE